MEPSIRIIEIMNGTLKMKNAIEILAFEPVSIFYFILKSSSVGYTNLTFRRSMREVKYDLDWLKAFTFARYFLGYSPLPQLASKLI